MLASPWLPLAATNAGPGLHEPSTQVPWGCPPAEDLEAALDGTLSAEAEDLLGDHLARCARCRKALETLAAGGSTDSRSGQTGPSFEPAEDPACLRRLGPYKVIDVIGRGGFGVVLKARDPGLGRLVAVKVLAPRLAGDAAARRRFAREARAAAAVRHENVVAVHEADEAGGLPYLVMEYLPGGSLQQLLRRDGPLPVAQAVSFGMQAAAGLAAVHARGLVHGDVKPANLLLAGAAGPVKITDFGLARPADDVSLPPGGLLAGTPQYMAPEQALGRPADHRADLFSLGSVLYALCAGRSPFRAGTALAVLRRVREADPCPLRDLNPAVPAWLADLIAVLHAKDPADRFQSAAEVAHLLGRRRERVR